MLSLLGHIEKLSPWSQKNHGDPCNTVKNKLNQCASCLLQYQATGVSYASGIRAHIVLKISQMATFCGNSEAKPEKDAWKREHLWPRGDELHRLPDIFIEMDGDFELPSC